jgi:2-polyprenyl-3-methyl-5-hydroxy-6-metoxy-1,4-benzoquinol methylase
MPATAERIEAPPSIHYRAHNDPKSSHQQISRRVRELHRGPVLDVGAAQGMLGRSIQDSGLTIDGVEMNPGWAELARPFYRTVWASSIEAAPLPEKTYQLIVCADVLEHTPDPKSVLMRLRAAATDDAVFVISVPNVAHLAVRMMLLLGRFPKMERGPLDRTHLQFLTKDTARELVESAGLKVRRFSTTGVPLDEIWKNGQGNVVYKAAIKAQHAALAVAPRLFGFQWIMEATA